MRLFFLLLLLLPIAELAVLIQVGKTIGVFQTLGLLLLMAILGVMFLRSQSASALSRARQRLQDGQVPARELVEGVMISFGGVLLLIPGFITDLLAMLLLFPPTRHAIVTWLVTKGGMAVFGGGPGAFVFTRFGGQWPSQSGPHRRDIYEGEFRREEEPKRPLDGPKPPSEP